MKKRNLVLATLALSLTLGSVVFAQEGSYSRRNHGFPMMNGGFYSNIMTEEDFNAMRDYMKANFGYSMMGDSYDDYVEYNGYGNSYSNGNGNGYGSCCGFRGN